MVSPEVCHLLPVGRYDGRHRVPEPDPCYTLGALTLHIMVAGLLPGQDSVPLVVEDEIATVSADHQDRMPFPLLVEYDRHAQGPLRQTCPDQEPALEELDVLAMAMSCLDGARLAM